MNKKSIVITVLISAISMSTAQAIYFEGYGNYLAMGRNDDGSSSQIPLGFNLDYYGNSYDSAYVNNNGNVTFDRPLWTYTPFAFPSTEKIIAPFFADVDTRPSNGGSVYYDHRNFRGQDEFIVTWDRVGYYDRHTSPVNTFQMVIQNDGDIGFSYGDMSWTRGDVSDVHAVAGFDAGNNRDYVMIDGSRTSSIANNLENKEFWFRKDPTTGGVQRNALNQVVVTPQSTDYIDLENRVQNAHWGGLEVRSKQTDNFEPILSFQDQTSTESSFDPNKDTVIMIHGWDGEGGNTALPDWVENMGDAFATRKGEQNVNIIAWNWQDNAQTAWFAPNEFVPGEAINAARELKQLFGDNYQGNIQILGHSLGSGVATRVTQYLQNEYSIDRLTLFDGPTEIANDVDLNALLPDINNDVYVENYVTSVGNAYYGGNINNVVLYNDIINNSSGPFLGSDDFTRAHSYGMTWYTETIGSPANTGSIGYNYRNSGGSPVTQYQNWQNDYLLTQNRDIWYSNAPATPRSLFDGSDVGHQNVNRWFTVELDQSDLDFYSTGEAWERDGVIYGQTNSPVFISSDLFIPVNADYLSFDLSILEWNDGDVFSLFWDDNLLMSFDTDFLVLDEWYDFDLIDISQWAGTSGTLTFGLITQQNGIHSQFGVTNIAFTSESVPEPGTLFLMLSSLFSLFFLKKMRNFA